MKALERVDLRLGQTLHEPHQPHEHFYFPETCIVSLLGVLANGDTSEVSLTGREGCVGLGLILGGDRTILRATVQSAGTALRWKTSALQRELKKLAEYAQSRGIRLYFMMLPDVHDLVDYKFMFVHDIMRGIAERDGYAYVDLLPVMSGLRPQEIWAMPGDPHPNAFAHKLMAEAIFPLIVRVPQRQTSIEK